MRMCDFGSFHPAHPEVSHALALLLQQACEALDRIEHLPQAVRDIAWRAQRRLCHRYRRLAAAGKPKVVVTTAIAREMVGFIWAIARMVQPQPMIR